MCTPNWSYSPLKQTLRLKQYSCRASEQSSEACQQSTLARGRESEKSVWSVSDGWENTREEDIVLCTHQSRCSVFRWASPYLSSRCVLPMTCSAVLYWSHQPRLCGRITSLIFIWSSLLPACLPAWMAAGQSVCVWESCLCIQCVCVHAHIQVCTVLIHVHMWVWADSVLFDMGP